MIYRLCNLSNLHIQLLAAKNMMDGQRQQQQQHDTIIILLESWINITCRAKRFHPFNHIETGRILQTVCLSYELCLIHSEHFHLYLSIGCVCVEHNMQNADNIPENDEPI